MMRGGHRYILNLENFWPAVLMNNDSSQSRNLPVDTLRKEGSF
jgi:hypothetical protein